MLLPVPEYPIFPEKDDWDEAAECDNSLYKEDGSLEVSRIYKKHAFLTFSTWYKSLTASDCSLWSIFQIDFSSLIDARILSKGMSEPDNETVACVSEASTGNVTAKTSLPGTSSKPTSEPSPGITFNAVIESEKTKLINDS